MTKTKSGFTIVELLIVVVVIAILAAISVVAYTGIQGRAQNSAIKSDLKSIATRIELHQAEKGSYPDGTALATLGLKATKSAYELTDGIHASHVHNLLYCRNPSSTSFALIARAKTGAAFQYANGTVGDYTGPLQSGDTIAICQVAGVTVVATPTYTWNWLYANGWASWVGS